MFFCLEGGLEGLLGRWEDGEVKLPLFYGVECVPCAVCQGGGQKRQSAWCSANGALTRWTGKVCVVDWQLVQNLCIRS